MNRENKKKPTPRKPKALGLSKGKPFKSVDGQARYPVSIRLNLTQEEIARIEHAADWEGEAPGDWIRNAARDGIDSNIDRVNEDQIEAYEGDGLHG